MNKKISTKELVYGGLLIAIGVILPQVFHVFGQAAGQTMLPMHIPVMLAGLLLGPIFGGLIGFIVPILSSLITGMPPVPMVYFMIFELAAYGIASGIFNKKVKINSKLNIYIVLILTMLCGRMVYGLTLVAAVNILGFNVPFGNFASFFGGIVTGLPGVAIQLVFIPPIIYALKKGGLLVERTA